MNGIWIAAFVAFASLVLLLGLLVLGTLRRITPLLERTEESLQTAATASLGGLPVGARVPPFEARDTHGASFTDGDLLGATSLVLFVGPSCRACERLVEDLRAGSVPYLGARLFVVPDSADLAPELDRTTGITVLVDTERTLARAFEMRVVPQAFVVDVHGVVLAAGRPNSWDEVQSLLATEGGDRDSDIAAAALAL